MTYVHLYIRPSIFYQNSENIHPSNLPYWPNSCHFPSLFSQENITKAVSLSPSVSRL